MKTQETSPFNGLLPCPCCGGKAEIGGDPHSDRDVHCTKCYLSMFDTCAEGAKMAWNKRVKNTKAENSQV